MTSFRDFRSDDAWNHLRTSESSRKSLVFEDQGDESFELIVPQSWPSRVCCIALSVAHAESLTSLHPTGLTVALQPATCSGNILINHTPGCLAAVVMM